MSEAPLEGVPPELIYFSTRSGNTHRFIQKLELPARRIPLERGAQALSATRPFVLVTPTYGGGETKGAVPAPVIRFLNDSDNRALLKGVIAAGNTCFGAAYGLAGRIIAEKCGVPLLYRFELLGTDDDVTRVRKGVREFWTRQS
ncbi:class Ib ribonucleoside-diphosphate reductase assembly flavoprotein NrdI [Halomonas sp. KAO]|uniref:class Ib ribonucleoside-diphosphate reductase assembly flavoprotein NrdI n=1 Tax=Halomonas sp. KAO TaxID=2783858 RepID=UPI00189FD836|nr:class Ib ribonucleoside-diphosphate reductase assembly flavoprotein NrdI [Halomonas sp. KAO]MBF7052621.1 class Ib ribonucleoside-diphosphate reductase assembly flavoprotein NrdI [Halomonas sp. KAO]